ncbi:MAG: hypothetical protein ABJK39_15080 [Hyphomicrobiales bacterium]
MTSGGDRKSGGRATGRGRSKSTASTQQSAQARARAAKKAVTIDLEAKDVTPKPQGETVASKTSAAAKAASEKITAPKTSAKPAEKPTVANDKAKAETSQAKPAATDSKPASAAASKKPETTSSTASAKKEAPINLAAKNEGAGAKTPPPPPAKKAEKSGGSFFPNLVASLIGGIIAIGGLIGLQKAEIIPSFGDSGVASLTSRVTSLEEVPAVDPVSQNEFVSLSERLDEMEQGIENNDKPIVPEEVLARLTALEARLADAETSTNGDASANTSAATGEATLPSGIAERLAAIEARLSANESAGVDGQIAALNEKVAKLDEGVATVQSALSTEGSNDQTAADGNSAVGANASADLSAKLAALQEKVAALEIPAVDAAGNAAFLTAARKSVFATIDPKFISLQSQLDETSLLLGAVQDKITTVESGQSDIGSKISALSEKLGSVEGTLDTQNATTASVQVATKSLALENLKEVAQNGGPFESALTSLERVGVEPEAIATLQPFSATGLKDTATLKNELNNLVTLAAAKAGPSGEAPKELSAFEKLTNNAKNLIKIRSVDSNEDAGPFGQLHAQFDEGNMDGFLETWGTLSDDQKRVFNQWLVEWKGNLALSSLIQKIEQDVAGKPANETSSQ